MKIFPTIFTNEDGFTLIEALVAMVVLTIGILSIYSMQISAIQGNSKASHVTIASNWAAERIEQIMSTPYDDLLDTDGDGTGQDTVAPFGIDDNVGNFGLDDTLAADGTVAADGQTTSPEGDYTVFWNVSFDYPVTGVKTIRIHIQDSNPSLNNIVTNNRTQSVTNSLVTLQYQKQGPI